MYLALARDVNPRVLELLRRWDNVDLALEAPRSVVITEGFAQPVNVTIVEADEIGRELPRTRADEIPFLIVNAVLDEPTAARLEDAGVAYLDAGGHTWLPTWKRTERARVSRSGPSRKRGLYPASLRLAQLLADHPLEEWSERRLAERGHTTQVTAHRLLARLEGEGLIEREGRGPATTRWISDAREMRVWLTREGRPKRTTGLTCFVRDPGALPELAGRSLALTGASAAAEIGLPVHTSEGLPTYRVNVASDELEAIPEALGGFRTESGPNMTLVADPDRLAFADPYFAGRRPLLAPPSRIMLDLYLEARGDAAVDVFLDLWDRRGISR